MYLCVLSRCLHAWWGRSSCAPLCLVGNGPCPSPCWLCGSVGVFIRTHMSVCISVSVSVSVASVCLCLGVYKYLCVSAQGSQAAVAPGGAGGGGWRSGKAPSGNGMCCSLEHSSAAQRPPLPPSSARGWPLAGSCFTSFPISSPPTALCLWTTLFMPLRDLREPSEICNPHPRPGTHPVPRSHQRAVTEGSLARPPLGKAGEVGRLSWHEAPPGPEL